VTDTHVRDRLGDHLEGDIPLDERARIEAHLARCAECADELRELRATVRLLRGLPDPEPPARLVPEVMRRIEAGEGSERRVVHFLRRAGEPRFAAALAAGIAGLVIFTSLDFGGRGLLGNPSDSSPGRLAVRSDPGGVTDVRAMGARRPLPLHRTAVAHATAPPERSFQMLVASDAVAPPQRPELQTQSPVARFGFFGSAAPEVPLRDLDAELEGLMVDPVAFLDRMRRTAEIERRPMIAPLVEHSARRGDVDAVARYLGMAAEPAAVPASTR
jgi:hypothetical protein